MQTHRLSGTKDAQAHLQIAIFSVFSGYDIMETTHKR